MIKEEENHFRSHCCVAFTVNRMPKLKDKRRENYSVASEIDRLEERRARCQDNLDQVEFRHRREALSEKERQDLEEEMTIMNERVNKLDQELQVLRGENRRNMVLSVALLAVSALFYYVFIYSEDQS
ncbi:coiled-coil domain-containing protein 167 [Boleophthalmus pectinirostris]|uniref:coiled-coil domain-containing protein 167 n=1 Tax=Boleophthalmus pectinirostris TaxID=150288 RepID=UPI002431486D|nr:coiled-coil domain-containing protein 167 [Boleophthalmus pectinirostris]